MTRLKPNEAAERTANGDELMLSGSEPQARRDPAVVAAVQQAIMKHPHFRDSGAWALAFGLANTAIDAYAAAISPSSDLEITKAEIMAIGDTAVWFKEKGYRKCSEVSEHPVAAIEEIAVAVHEGRFSEGQNQINYCSFDDECTSGRAYCRRIAHSIRQTFDVRKKGLSALGAKPPSEETRETPGLLVSDPVLFNILNKALGTMHYHRLMSALNWNGYEIIRSGGPGASEEMVEATDLIPLFRDAASVNMTEDAVERQARRLADAVLSLFDVRRK